MEFIQKQNEIRDDYKIIKDQSPVVVVLRKRSTKGIIFLLTFSIVVPILVYYFVIDKGTYPPEEDTTCSVRKTYRIHCGKTTNVTIDYCTSIHCCYDNSTQLCFHYLPSKYNYFGEESNYQRSLEKTPFNRTMSPTVTLTVNDIDENHVQIVLHKPDMIITSNNLTSDVKEYYWNISHSPLYVEVYRNDDSRDLLLTTAHGPTIISEKYWEWSFQLTDEFLFGLGQTVIDLDENSTLTRVIYANGKDHSTLPVFMAYKGGKYHGLVVKHSGPLEVTVIPSKIVSLKSLAGEKIELELSTGPTVKDVVRQLRQNRKISVDLETLGVHLCREGATLDVESMTEELQTGDADQVIPFNYETDCIHEHLLMGIINENKTYNVIDTINQIKSSSRNFVLALSPQVLDESFLYHMTNDSSVFYQTQKNNKTENYKGEFLKEKVLYPYFDHEMIDEFLIAYIDVLKIYFGELPTHYVLNYNWPLDDSFTMEYLEDDFQYFSHELIEAMSSTLPWNVTSGDDLHFLHHNDYGSLQLNKLKAHLPDAKFFMTASHNLDTTEPLIIQNVDISWTNFKKAIVTTLYNSVFGFPLTSFPVCGSTSYFNSSHESLCMRWYIMASTAPIFRISSELPRRDPVALSKLTTNLTALKAKEAIDFRYSLRYYYYTVMNLYDEPLMRPMFYDFPDDRNTFPLVDQYMVGGSLLVAQPTLPEQSQINVYFPNVNTTDDDWYEFWGGDAYTNSSGRTGWQTFFIVETDWVVFIRGGSIVPLVETDEDDENTKTVSLVIALNSNNTANGRMQYSEMVLDFESTYEELTITNYTDTSQIFIFNVKLYGNESVERYDGIQINDMPYKYPRD